MDHRRFLRIIGPTCLTLVCLGSLLLSAVAAERLRFVAYNVENYLPMERRVNGDSVPSAPKPESEKRVVVASLVELAPDIIGLAEMGDLAQVEDLRGRLAAQGLKYPHVEWVDAADAERHLVLLSRHPIVERNSVKDLTYRIGDQELPVQRGFLDVTVAVKGGYRLRCVGVHLKSKRSVPEADETLMRRNEAELLRRHVDAILTAGPKTNLLVYGDFNDTRNETPIRSIQGKRGTDRYLETIYLKDDQGLSWTHFWEYADLYSRIDFVMVAPGLRPEVDFSGCRILRRKDWNEGSDHRPLLVTLTAEER
ncbi:MAG: Metal-dependent hydrolase, endonuclease/exonuclease/phosphatase family [Verrucomicrobia bacterium]|nr:MAG: Metal-dependent hydrolase, endonuclease/exonuclease/phosphatase family [Verrucomicrobiota bacterium]